MSLNKLLKWCRDWWRDPYRPCARWTDKAIVLLTLGIVFLAQMQWKEMDDSGKQTDKIIRADDRIATAMENTVGQAQQSLDATIDQNQLNQRAWLGECSAAVQKMEPGQAGTFTVCITNSGNTPALNVEAVHRTEWSDHRDGPTHFEEIQRKNASPMGSLNPHQIQFIVHTMPVLNDTDISNIKAGRLRIFIYGTVWYSDIFVKPHLTEYCVKLEPTLNAFSPCRNHNQTT